MTNDTRKLVSGQITWHEDRKSGRGYLTMRFEDGGSEEIQWDEPISGNSDAWDIANLFDGYDFQSVERDREVIHVTALA